MCNPLLLLNSKLALKAIKVIMIFVPPQSLIVVSQLNPISHWFLCLGGKISLVFSLCTQCSHSPAAPCFSCSSAVSLLLHLSYLDSFSQP